MIDTGNSAFHLLLRLQLITLELLELLQLPPVRVTTRVTGGLGVVVASGGVVLEPVRRAASVTGMRMEGATDAKDRVR